MSVTRRAHASRLAEMLARYETEENLSHIKCASDDTKKASPKNAHNASQQRRVYMTDGRTNISLDEALFRVRDFLQTRLLGADANPREASLSEVGAAVKIDLCQWEPLLDRIRASSSITQRETAGAEMQLLFATATVPKCPACGLPAQKYRAYKSCVNKSCLRGGGAAVTSPSASKTPKNRARGRRQEPTACSIHRSVATPTAASVGADGSVSGEECVDYWAEREEALALGGCGPPTHVFG